MRHRNPDQAIDRVLKSAAVQGAKVASRITSELIVALGIVAVYVALLANWWFSANHFPLHDTLHVYETFQMAFSQFVQTGDLPQWLPYSNYGMPTYLRDLITMPPFYLAAIGTLGYLHITDTWLVYRGLLFFDAALYSAGVFLLAREYASRWVAAIISASLLWTLVLDFNFQLTLRLVSLMPLILLFLLRWARSADLHNLVYVIVAILLSCWGVPPYDVPVYGLVYGFSAIGLFLAYRPSIRVPSGWRFWMWVLFATGLSAATAYLYVTSVRNLDFFSPYRDPKTLEVSRNVFLTYGGGGIQKTSEAFIAAPFGSVDAFFYAGAVVLVFALYAISEIHSPDLSVWSVLFGIFLIFCWGRFSLVAWLAFYLPGMNYVRHIGLMYAIPKVFLGILAAMGLGTFSGRLFSCDKQVVDFARRSVARGAGLTGAIAGAWAVGYFVILRRDFGLFEKPRSYAAGVLLLIFLAIVGFKAIQLIVRHGSPQFVLPLLLTVVFVQSAGYQGFYSYDLLDRPWHLPSVLRQVHSWAYVGSRSEKVAGLQASWLQSLTSRGAYYPELDSFLNIDFCTPNTRVDYFVKGVAELFRRQLGSDVTPDRLHANFKSNPQLPLWKVLGCGVSKLQWVPGTQGAKLSPKATWPNSCVAQELCLEDQVSGERLILPWPGGRPPESPNLAPESIILRKFSFNTITFTTAEQQSGWVIDADAYHPDWHAIIDGRDVPVWRANFAFKAVRIPAGSHTICLFFGNRWRNRLFWIFGLSGTVALLILFAVAASGLPGAGRLVKENTLSDGTAD